MLDFRDYVEEEKKDAVFKNGMEETVAYISWMDMFLEAHGSDDDSEYVKGQLAEGLKLLAHRSLISEGEEFPLAYGIGITNIAAEYGLRGFSFFCLLLAVAPEMDNKYLKIYEELSGYEPGLTMDLAESLYSLMAEEEELLDMGRQINTISSCPVFIVYEPRRCGGRIGSAFTVSAEVLSAVKGDFVPRKEIDSVIFEAEATGHLDAFVYKKELSRLENYLASKKSGKELIHVRGKGGCGGRDFVLHAFREGQLVLFISYRRLNLMKESGNLLSDALIRCRLLHEALVIEDTDEADIRTLVVLLSECFSQFDLLYLITGEDISLPEEKLSCDVYKVFLGVPDKNELADCWKIAMEGLNISDDVSFEELANKYRITPGEIALCVNEATSNALSNNGKIIDNEYITAAVLARTAGKLDELCERVPLKFSRDDLIIDKKQREVLDLLVSRVKNRSKVDFEWGFESKIPYGRGVSILFYGPPGTGKTMSAMVIAREIGLALYRVDISSLVDKYIGETEKNIGRIFDAAAGGNAILFFDEADALFAKRTEVSNSNDKHANTEVAFLLQKIEQFDGVTILATNRYNNFDEAFIRRINYAIYLEKPNEARRLELLTSVIPDKMPKAPDLDLSFFANSFELSGSEIKEIIYSAAFIAAADAGVLSNAHIVKSIKYHFEKMGKLVSADAFGKYSYLIY
ncbi:MAG: ATP-binding protein [Lachnospiraceae bacterium]|nr:ATP-binding protein [Lachnospiraceae bacterium]